MVSRHGNSSISISGEIREAFKGAADLILPYRCALCGDVSDSEDRFENFDSLYRQLYGKDSGLHLCGKCLSDLVSTDEQGRWLLCLSNPVENDPCPGLALYLLFPYKKGFCLKLCYADKLANKVLLIVGGMAIMTLVAYHFTRTF